LLATITSFGLKALACHYPKYAFFWLQWLLSGGKHWLAIILNMLCRLQWLLLGGKHYRLAIILNVLVGYNDFVQVENIYNKAKKALSFWLHIKPNVWTFWIVHWRHKTHATQPMSRPKKLRDTNQSSLAYNQTRTCMKLQSKENLSPGNQAFYYYLF
jgi:hypothetical protein